MKYATLSLLSAAVLSAGPCFAQAATPVAEEAAAEIEVIDGVPVNPQLRERIMQSPEKRSVEELIDLSNEVVNQQQQDLAAQTAAQEGDDAWLSNPFGHLEGEMGSIATKIDDGQTGEQTQTQGKEVVQKLDTLITLMEQACSACQSCSSSGSGNKPGPANGSNPAQDSSLAQGPGGMGELRDNSSGNFSDENLSDNQRDQILRSAQDGFPEGYEQLLAEYYARLATESDAQPQNADNQ